MKRFILENDVCLVRNEDEEIYASAEQVAREFFSSGAYDIGLLPPAIRWMSSNGRALILERPPEVASVVTEDTMWDVPMPWTVWGMRFSGVNMEIEESYVFARSYPLSTMNDELFHLPLPGIPENGEVDLRAVETKNPYDVGSTLYQVLYNFWNEPRSDEIAKDLVPEEWRSNTETVEKYYVFLEALDIEDMTFADFLPAMTVGSFVETLTEEKRPESAVELFAEMARRARDR